MSLFPPSPTLRTAAGSVSALLTAIAALTPAEGSFLIGTAANSWDAVEPTGMYGTGADGSKTVVGTETLTDHAQYTTLTVPVGTTLITDGYRILVQGVCTVEGTIHDDGNPGSGATAGTALATRGIRTIGATGGNGRSLSGAGTAAGSLGTVYALGGYNPAGGDGGAISGNAAGAGSSLATVTATDVKSRARIMAGTAYTVSSATIRPERGSGAGGGGACSGAPMVSGAGGTGGGRVQLIARVLKGSGTIRANGGAGSAAAGASGSGGGGGGGSGGQVEIIAGYSAGWSGTTTATGGAAGSSINATVAAQAGGNGLVAVFREWA